MERQTFIKILSRQILVLDGAMGTMIQTFHLNEKDYRGLQFVDWPVDLRGNNDVLNITQPKIIAGIQRQYLDAGANIITTNTFNANAISIADYAMERYVREINLSAARLSRSIADEFIQSHPGQIVLVAGSCGPTNKTASMSADVNNPASRAVTYDDLYNSYREQISALVDGGVDLILFETTFDTLNVKAGLEAADSVLNDKKSDLPIMVSLTLSSKGGRTFSGQTLQAFVASIMHSRIVSVGLNCSFGAEDMLPHLEDLASFAPFYISAYPNAGLPNIDGSYDETPEKMSNYIRRFVDEGLVNVIGGCCGTTPQHIAYYQDIVRGKQPHVPSSKPDCLWLSGLELLEVKPENNFVNVGERCNVAGSRKFLRLIKEKQYEEALTIARKQVEDGAQVIDINMDDGLLDAEKEMTYFLNLIASEPDISRVPVMIDSSKWEVIESALKCLQGKSIVNSISLKEGEEVFLYRAERIRKLGSAVVVMAFDENGQAETFERKIQVCERAYKLLLDKIAFDSHDIIFDPNVLAIATGIEEHNNYARDFIRAVSWIKANLPGAKVSGGVSNLSFSFRGNNYIREAMHSVFLYHAIRAGMDMGIVNPSSSVLYEDIEPEFRTLLEDVILARRPEAAEDLIGYAQHVYQVDEVTAVKQDSWRNEPLEARLEYALVKGVGDYLEDDLQEALRKYPRAVNIIDGPLMNGMNKVGTLFGAGKMFLPQVVKTARTMKKAVAILKPVIEAEKNGSITTAGKILFATVKGDVHDIGKNIVSIVLSCNNYEVIDLGVMVPAETIVKKAIEEKPDLVCLSGLITPSLGEMVHVVEELQKAGLSIPVMVGGATTSKLHTALKIAPFYSSPVVHVTDASQNPLIAAKLLNPETHDAFISQLSSEYEALRHSSEMEKTDFVSLKKIRINTVHIDWKAYQPPVPRTFGRCVFDFIPLEKVIPFINWTYFFNAWKLNGRFSEIAFIYGCDVCRASWLANFPQADREKAEQAMQLFKDAKRMLNYLCEINAEYCKAVFQIFTAYSQGDDLIVGGERIPMLRQQVANKENVYKCLADYVMPKDKCRLDYVGAFAVTGGAGAEYLLNKIKKEGDTYRAMLLQTLCDRLAEATSEYLHAEIRRSYWGYSPDESLSIDDLFKVHYRGIRPAIGYPSIPDQKLIATVDCLLNMKEIGIHLTENGAMFPSASVSGLYIAHPLASYFMIGEIDVDQMADYASRRNISTEEVRSLLGKSIQH